jgi:predicted phosphodiesterase
MGKKNKPYRPRLTSDEWEILKNYRLNPSAFTEFQKMDEIIEENVKLAKQKQRYQDSNRIERAAFRKQARTENAIEELNKQLIAKFDELDFTFKTKVHEKGGQYSMLVQVSDLHFNELVDLPHNKYDFKIAAKRLKLYATEVKRQAKAYGITKIVVALTGDLMNSDRRLDEILHQASSRAKASLIGTRLLQMFILDLNEVGNITVCGVSGNEARNKDEIGFSDQIVSDNYDFIIYNMLKLVFRGSEGVKFVDGQNPKEMIVTVNNCNFLLTHGESIKQGDSQGSIQKLIGKFNIKGYTIDYVIFGHIHFTNMTDIYGRSGSLVGSNGYSDRALDLITRAAQNTYIIDEQKNINGFKFNLQNTEGVQGYPIEDDLDAYDINSLGRKEAVSEEIRVVV